MTRADHNTLTVDRLTLRHCDGNTAAARLRAEHRLELADLRPAGLPSGAILVVRSLKAAPTRLAALADSRWSDALRQKLDHLYHAAARPMVVHPPASAESVLFLDAAELVTCLTRDLLQGVAHSHWYWRQQLHRLAAHPGAALAQVWVEHARVLPAALAQLGPAIASAALRQLNAAQVQAIAGALAANYALPSAIFAREAGAPAAVDLAPPWQPWLPDAAPMLTREAERVLGVGLALWYAPALVYTTTFVEKSRAYVADQALDRHDRAAAGTTPPDDQPGASPAHTQPAPDASQPMPSAQAAHADLPFAEPEAVDLPQASPPLSLEPSNSLVSTRLAGVFYLINILVALDWPRYEPADASGAVLSGWRLLEALARVLLDAAPGDDDALWQVLALLDRRPVDLPVSEILDAQAATWLVAVVAQARARIAHRLRDPRPEAIPPLLRVPGRIRVSRTHIDLHMSLEAINIPTRAAGLDRDPGWVPELGRAVLFHYER